MALDPDFTKGRPYMYIQYYPYWGGEQGKDTEPKLGTGFDRRTLQGREAPLALHLRRRDQDASSPARRRSSSPTSSPVYNCCHNGAGMALDSKGNLYITNGDSDAERHHRQRHRTTSPTTTTAATPTRTRTSRSRAPARRRPRTAATFPADQRPADTGPLISYGDARGTSGNTNVYEGKIIRIKPLADPGDTPGVGTTYTIPGADAPNGANLFAAGQPAGAWTARPSRRSSRWACAANYTIHIDKKTDAITTAWIGPDQGTENGIWGPAKTENATMMNSSGNWGWPFCQAGNRWGYRAKTPSLNRRRPRPRSAHPSTVGGGADGADRRLLRLPRRDRSTTRRTTPA